MDERNRTGGGLNDDLVLRQCPSDDSQTHPVQHMTWAQFQKDFRSKALGLLGVRTKIKEWVVETIVIQPRHAPTIDRRAGSAAMGARRAVDRRGSLQAIAVRQQGAGPDLTIPLANLAPAVAANSVDGAPIGTTTDAKSGCAPIRT